MKDHEDFIKKLNFEGEGTPRDIQPATDDTTFERQSRDAVKLYRLVVIIKIIIMHISISQSE